MQHCQRYGLPTVSHPGRNGFNNRTIARQRITGVQQFALFSGISAGDCTNILSATHGRHFSRRQIIFCEGDPIRQIFLPTAGCVKVTQVSQDGSAVILRINGPGEVLGLEVWSGGNHCSTAQALQSSSALVWDAASFEALSERLPILRRNIARILGRRLQELEERFREISTEKAALRRLSSQLVRLLSQVGRLVNGEVEVSLSREVLGQLTGTTLFTVSRLLSKWQQRGILAARREAVLVRNLPALVELSQGE